MASPTAAPATEAEPPVTHPELRECFGCGMFQIVPALGPDQRADCARCGTALRRTRTDSFGRGIALNAATLVLFVVLWTTMLMTVSTAGIVHDSTLASGPLELVRHGLWPLALIVAFTTAIAPLGKYAGMLYVLIGARARTPFPYLGRVFRFARTMGIWAMLEVLLLGVFVAFTKLGDLVHIEVGPAVWALGLLTITALWADTAVDPDAVWEAIERSGQTQAPLPEDRSLVFHPGMVGASPAAWWRRMKAPITRAPSTAPACAAARRCIRASPTLSTAPGPISSRPRSSTSRPTSIRC